MSSQNKPADLGTAVMRARSKLDKLERAIYKVRNDPPTRDTIIHFDSLPRLFREVIEPLVSFTSKPKVIHGFLEKSVPHWESIRLLREQDYHDGAPHASYVEVSVAMPPHDPVPGTSIAATATWGGNTIPPDQMPSEVKFFMNANDFGNEEHEMTISHFEKAFNAIRQIVDDLHRSRDLKSVFGDDI